MWYDTNMELTILKGKIRGAGKTYFDVARELEIGVNTLSNKLNGRSDFTASEIATIASMLELSCDELIQCFLLGRMTEVSQK